MTINKRAYPYIASFITALVILTVVSFISIIEKKRFKEQKRAEVLQQLSVLRARIEGALNSRLYLTQSVAAYIATHPDIRQKEFEQLARELVSQDPVINTISLSKNSIISHLYPLRGHESALGLDLMAHPKRREIVEKTIKNRKGFVAGPVELIEGGTALISYTPIFSAVPHGNLKAGAYWGLTDITIMMDRLFKEAGLYYESPTLSIAIRGIDGMGDKGDVFWGEAAVFQSKPVRLNITLPNGSWEMAAIPKGGWVSASPFYLVLWTGGLVLTLSGSLLAFVLVRMPLRLKELVEQATESLSENEKKYRELVENANSIILKMDTNGNITFINEFAEDFFGYKEHEILGRNVLGTIVPAADSYNNDHSLMIQDICSVPWKYATNENENMKKSGERVWVAWTNKGIYENKILTGVLCIGNDITMFKKAEQELQKYRYELEDMVKERTEELAEANEKLRKISAYKSEFLAGMSHDIRTPMNAILGMADLLWETELDPEQLQYVQVFRSAGENLLTLINDILDLSKVEAGQLALEAIDFDLNEVLEKLCGIMAITAQAKDIKLAYHIMSEVPKYLIGDPHRIHQILVNLIGNAIKFTEKGEVVVEVKMHDSRYMIQNIGDIASYIVHPESCILLFSVRDTGIGIPQEKIDTVFNGFTQVDSSTTRKYGGTGLGLTISKRLTEMMGGAIRVESKLGEGSTFYFTAKLGVQSMHKKQIQLPEVNPVRNSKFLNGINLTLPKMTGLSNGVKPSGIEDTRALSILLVDDSKDNRLLIESYLKKTPHKIEIAENGEIAVEKFKSGKYDIVLMDMQMPVMDGYTAAGIIRKWEGEKGVKVTPIIALTAYALKEDTQKSIEAGCTAHLTKPIKKAKLIEALSEYSRG